jgi:Cu+-exporting ATPase
VELAIGGMTCASCAARIEKKLNRMDGVSATVNYATEKARVQYAGGVEVADLVATVEATGYTATPPPARADTGGPAPSDGAVGGAQPAEGGPAPRREDADPSPAVLRQRLVTAVVLALPVVVLSMVPALQFPYWQWLSLVLTSPVVVYAAWPFHRAAFVAARHGAATMDTLVSVGVLAAYGWSLWALFFGGAGTPGMTHPFTFRVSRGEGADQIYLEAAAGVTAFLLAGRFFEARAKRRAGAALRALMELGARDAAVLRDGREVRVPVGDLRVGDLFVVRPGEKVATDGVVREGGSAIDASLLTGESVPVEVGPGSAVAGATVNAGGRLVVEVVRVGADTQLARMARMVEDAQNGKAAAQRLADRIAGVFVPTVITLAVATLGVWLGLGEGATAAFTAAVAVLVIACP